MGKTDIILHDNNKFIVHKCSNAHLSLYKIGAFHICQNGAANSAKFDSDMGQQIQENVTI